MRRLQDRLGQQEGGQVLPHSGQETPVSGLQPEEPQLKSLKVSALGRILFSKNGTIYNRSNTFSPLFHFFSLQHTPRDEQLPFCKSFFSQAHGVLGPFN